LMYDTGQGVPQNYTEAVKWYRLAAVQGNAVAQFNLGLIYAKGESVPQDYTEAAKWYRLAAEQGDTEAQANLGTMYINGEGVIQNDIDAYMWVSIAASSGDLKTLEILDLVAKRMTAAEISKAQDLARECLSKNYKDCGSSGFAENVSGSEWSDFTGILLLLVTVGIATLAYRNLKRRAGG